MNIESDFQYAHKDEFFVDYSASYYVPWDKEPAPTLENLYPSLFPVDLWFCQGAQAPE